MCICILWGGTCPLHVTSAEAATWASLMHDPRGGTSVVLPDGVCEVYIAVMDSASLLALQPDQSPLEREAKVWIGGGKWRDLVPGVYHARPIITVSLTSLVTTARWAAQRSRAARRRLQSLI